MLGGINPSACILWLSIKSFENHWPQPISAFCGKAHKPEMRISGSTSFGHGGGQAPEGSLVFSNHPAWVDYNLIWFISDHIRLCVLLCDNTCTHALCTDYNQTEPSPHSKVMYVQYELYVTCQVAVGETFTPKVGPVGLWWMGRAGILLTYPVVGRFWCVGLSVVWSTLEQIHLLSKKQKWYEMIRLCRFKNHFLGHFRAWGRVPAMTKPTCSKGPTFKLFGTPRHSPTSPFQYPKNMFDFNGEKMSFSAGAWLEHTQIIDISCEVFASCWLVFFFGCPFFNDF